ncbi:hypothetical protein HaLaN_00997 [Haematococcus lacustris]|uniref:Uncharacterized protein n=1 Tax=Haematococcus lacustris TaxID=44745 RepID=A0A699Y871_HAELA|nr:hypothetical protein HaLaN_00997 [Haematococcus lacustris]
MPVDARACALKRLPEGRPPPRLSRRIDGIASTVPNMGLLRITSHPLASGALILASESMPAQAIADTPQLLTIKCISGGVGGPSLGKLTRDIAARCENVRFSLANNTKKGPPCTNRLVVS